MRVRRSRRERILLRTPALLAAAVLLLLTASLAAPGSRPAAEPNWITFADEDRSAELAGEVPHQQYQFNTPTTVTYDKDTLTADPSTARVYVADVGHYKIRVFDLTGRLIGELNDQDTLLDPESPASQVPTITAPLGIYFLSRSEADDDRLAGLYVNDIGTHQIHFYHTDPTNPDTFYYVTSWGVEGHGGGLELKLPRNLVVTPQGYLYVSDEFNHRVKGFVPDPATYTATLVTTRGWTLDGVEYLPAGPIIRGVDKDYGLDSTYYDDYAGSPEKVEGFRIPQGLTYWRSPDGSRTYVYVCDNGNNRIKIFEVNAGTGELVLVDILGRFVYDGAADHLKRPRGVRTDRDGNLYVADTYNGRILKFKNLADPATGEVRYRPTQADDAVAVWKYGRLGLHQVEMRDSTRALTEDEVMQLPNDAVPMEYPGGGFYTEDIWAWGVFYEDAPVVLVSDPGNHRIKKCWVNPDPNNEYILRCSVSEGVGGVSDHEFWGHPRTLAGQLHYVGGLAFLPDNGSVTNVLLVSDTPNTRINMYDASGGYLGLFSGGSISYGVTGLDVYQPTWGSDPYEVGVLVASDASLPYPYTGDSALRIYDHLGNYEDVFNLTYRTSGYSVPAISYFNNNYPVAVDIRLEDAANDIFGVYVTTYQNYVWRFEYDWYWGTLTEQWYAGGPDPNKGDDAGENWALGPAFYEEGAAGTFDQIQDVTAIGDRVYVADRRNQRIQVLDAATGAYVGKVGQGGGTYDHPTAITADQFFLPMGVDYDAVQGAFLVGDGFNMIAREYDNPAGYAPDANGQISPTFLGYWLDPHLGTRPGGLFSAEHVKGANGWVYVNSLISNRITAFKYEAAVPPPGP